MKNFGLDEQMQRLGLENLLSAPKTMKFLDVGCGRAMALVRHMQTQGFYAEGLDEEISEHYLGSIKQNVSALWPNEGSIPRKNGFYDLVVAHQNPYISESASELRDTTFISIMVYRYEDREEKQKKNVDPITRTILSEMFRVTAESGVTLIYPGIQFLDKRFPEVIPEKKIIKHLPVGEIPKENLQIWFEDAWFGIVREDVSFMATHRTAVYDPDRINPELARAFKIEL